MRTLLFFCFYTGLCFAADAQQLQPVRYRDLVFAETTVRKELSYAMTEHPGIKKKHYRFDLYEPAADTATGRPLIIWLHGGGFKFGSKNATGIELWSKTFAQRGYVCAGLNYRLSKKNTLFNFDYLKQACYDAMTDIDEAIAFFKQHAAEYRIDTSRIILAGNSAGGMIALQAAYSDREEFASLAKFDAGTNINKNVKPPHIAAVINLWGGMFRMDWLNHSAVPLFSAYGDRDKIVPVDRKDTSLYGAVAIHAKATELRIPNTLKVYEGYSHELQKHFNPIFPVGYETKQRWLDVGQRAADFLYAQLFQQTGK